LTLADHEFSSAAKEILSMVRPINGAVEHSFQI
jgi:hypothetical protein